VEPNPLFQQGEEGVVYLFLSREILGPEVQLPEEDEEAEDEEEEEEEEEVKGEPQAPMIWMRS